MIAQDAVPDGIREQGTCGENPRIDSFGMTDRVLHRVDDLLIEVHGGVILLKGIIRGDQTPLVGSYPILRRNTVESGQP